MRGKAGRGYVRAARSDRFFSIPAAEQLQHHLTGAVMTACAPRGRTRARRADVLGLLLVVHGAAQISPRDPCLRARDSAAGVAAEETLVGAALCDRTIGVDTALRVEG